jgi:hypothetical protein
MKGIRRFHRSPWTTVALASAFAFSVACHVDWLDAPAAQVSVYLPASTFSLAQGESKPIEVTVLMTGFANARVELSVEGLPSGVTATFSKTSLSVSGGGETSSLSIKSGLNVPLQTFTLVVRARAKDYKDATASLSVTVAASPARDLGEAHE